MERRHTYIRVMIVWVVTLTALLAFQQSFTS